MSDDEIEITDGQPTLPMDDDLDGLSVEEVKQRKKKKRPVKRSRKEVDDDSITDDEKPRYKKQRKEIPSYPPEKTSSLPKYVKTTYQPYRKCEDCDRIITVSFKVIGWTFDEHEDQVPDIDTIGFYNCGFVGKKPCPCKHGSTNQIDSPIGVRALTDKEMEDMLSNDLKVEELRKKVIQKNVIHRNSEK